MQAAAHPQAPVQRPGALAPRSTGYSALNFPSPKPSVGCKVIP